MVEGGGASWQKTASMASAPPLADLQPYSLLLLLLELYVGTTSTECSSQRFAKKGKKLAFFAGTLSKIIESPKKPVDVYITLSKSRLWGGRGSNGFSHSLASSSLEKGKNGDRI